MRLSQDMDMAEWLDQFVPESDHFDWDAGNKHKIEKHHVTIEDVESLMQQEQLVFAGRITEPAHSEWRGLILGMDRSRRLLTLIFTRRGEKI